MGNSHCSRGCKGRCLSAHTGTESQWPDYLLERRQCPKLSLLVLGLKRAVVLALSYSPFPANSQQPRMDGYLAFLDLTSAQRPGVVQLMGEDVGLLAIRGKRFWPHLPPLRRTDDLRVLASQPQELLDPS